MVIYISLKLFLQFFIQEFLFLIQVEIRETPNWIAPCNLEPPTAKDMDDWMVIDQVNFRNMICYTLGMFEIQALCLCRYTGTC